MRIAVCMKAVVEPESRIELDDAGRPVRSHFRYELNEYDLYAVEEAIRMAGNLDDARVTVVTVGPEDAAQPLRKGLAMGADDAIHVHSAEDLADPAASAAVLAAVLAPREPDLVLAGVESDDLGGSQVGVLLAEALGHACVTMTIGVEVEPGAGVAHVRRELESGNYVNVDVRIPCVMTIQTGINEPRYPSLKGIMAAKRKELQRLEIGELDVAVEPRVETTSLEYPPPRERARMLEGGTEAVVEELLRVLQQEEKVL